MGTGEVGFRWVGFGWVEFGWVWSGLVRFGWVGWGIELERTERGFSIRVPYIPGSTQENTPWVNFRVEFLLRVVFNDKVIQQVFCYFGNEKMASLANKTSKPSIGKHIKIAGKQNLLFLHRNAFRI